MFRNMKYVYSVYKERSFSKAAEKLHIAQSSLSAMIKKIEDDAGTPIFERKTRPISLTPFGVEYIRSIKQVNEIQEKLYNSVNEFKTLQKGKLSIGGSNLSIPYILPQKIASFKIKYPNVILEIKESSTIINKQMLDSGELDIVITNKHLNNEEYEKILCYKENLIVVVPKSFEINKELKKYMLNPSELRKKQFLIDNDKMLPLQFLKNIPFIMLHYENYLRLCCEKMFNESNFDPKIVMELENSSIAYNFASLQIGATIISDVLIEHLDTSNLCFYMPKSIYSKREAYICYKKSRFMTSAMEKFIEELRI